MLGIHLPIEIEQRLVDLAKRTGHTKAFHAQPAIVEHINEMEGAYLAAAQLEKPGKRWTQDELEQARDLER